MIRFTLRPDLVSRAATALAVLMTCVVSPTQAAFTEEAVARGINFQTTPFLGFGQGVALLDLDNDGDPDAVVLGRASGVVGVYENDGTGQFTDRSATSGIPVLTTASGISAADYDGDFDLDLYIANFNTPNTLLRNDGAFTFTDVTTAAGVGDSGAGQGCAWGDYDGDGRVDLYVANRTAEGSTVPNRLFRNLGDGSFSDVLGATGMDGDDWTFQAVFFDLDQDNDADLYISNDKCEPRNRMWRNVGGTFIEQTAETDTGACMDSMGVAVGDFDRDGAEDLYATNTPSGNPLYLSQATDPFLEYSVQAGVGSYATGWCSIFLDYDNDAYTDLFVCNQGPANRLYRHTGSWPCTDNAAAAGVADVGQLTYCAAAGDVDGDGDLDLLVSNTPGPVRLFVNQEPATRHWLRLNVVGQGQNTYGVGTRVEVRTGLVTQMREVHAGANTFKSQNEMTLHFGLDQATAADQVRVFWPQGSGRTLFGLGADLVWTAYPTERLGDADQDGDVALDDFVGFADCHGVVLAPGCEMMDLDGDGDVDNADFTDFLTVYDGPLHDCDDNGTLDLQDIIDGTASDSGNGVPDGCETLGAASGQVPDGSGTGGPLTGERLAGGDVRLTWSASCRAGDGDYAIYEGSLGGAFTGHAAKLCTTGGATEAGFTPAAGSTYYLVVPHNGAREGSYGVDSGDAERVQGAGACLVRQLAGCD